MKDYKNLIIISLAGLALVFYGISQNERFERFEQRSEVYTLKQENNALKAALIERDSIIVSSYEWHNRVRKL